MLFRYTLFIFILIIFVKTTFAMAASPPELFFNGSINENICKSITLNGTENIIILDRWVKDKEKTKDLSQYNIKSEDLKLNFNYLNQFYLEGHKSINICLNSKRTGEYFGVLLIQSREKPVGLGIWINAKITSLEEEKVSLINSNVIKENETQVNPKIVIFLLIILILLSVLVYLLIKKLHLKI